MQNGSPASYINRKKLQLIKLDFIKILNYFNREKINNIISDIVNLIFINADRHLLKLKYNCRNLKTVNRNNNQN